jgi:hypothetical protein
MSHCNRERPKIGEYHCQRDASYRRFAHTKSHILHIREKSSESIHYVTEDTCDSKSDVIFGRFSNYFVRRFSNYFVLRIRANRERKSVDVVKSPFYSID